MSYFLYVLKVKIIVQIDGIMKNDFWIMSEAKQCIGFSTISVFFCHLPHFGK